MTILHTHRILALAVLSIGFVGILGSATPVQAASITWTNGTFSSNSILPSAASVTGAVDEGGFGATSDSGVVFVKQRRYDNPYDLDPLNPINKPGNLVDTTRDWNESDNMLVNGAITLSTGDVGFDTVLNTGYNTQGQSRNNSITLINLTVGQAYQVLLLAARNTSDYSTMQASDSDTGGDAGVLTGPRISALQQYNFTTTTGPVGGYLLGTFVADATTQTFWEYTPNGEAGQLNALVVSAIPEPASLSVLALGAMGLLARRRR